MSHGSECTGLNGRFDRLLKTTDSEQQNRVGFVFCDGYKIVGCDPRAEVTHKRGDRESTGTQRGPVSSGRLHLQIGGCVSPPAVGEPGWPTGGGGGGAHRGKRHHGRPCPHSSRRVSCVGPGLGQRTHMCPGTGTKFPAKESWHSTRAGHRVQGHTHTAGRRFGD